jgi:hypothetical protein
MGLRGQRKFICGECHQATFFKLYEINKAARIRCSACGSARLEHSPESKGRDELARAQDVLVDGGTPSIRPARLHRPWRAGE